jgi:hypothetical protein
MENLVDAHSTTVALAGVLSLVSKIQISLFFPQNGDFVQGDKCQAYIVLFK